LIKLYFSIESDSNCLRNLIVEQAFLRLI